jgi:chaperone modulatory protein CbpM
MRDDVREAGSWLTLEELSRAVSVSPDWVSERVQAGLIEVEGESGGAGGPGGWRFDAVVVRRVRSMQYTERCYGAVPELAALVADLEGEIARLRARLARFDR